MVYGFPMGFPWKLQELVRFWVFWGGPCVNIPARGLGLRPVEAGAGLGVSHHAAAAGPKRGAWLTFVGYGDMPCRTRLSHDNMIMKERESRKEGVKAVGCRVVHIIQPDLSLRPLGCK